MVCVQPTIISHVILNFWYLIHSYAITVKLSTIKLNQNYFPFHFNWRYCKQSTHLTTLPFVCTQNKSVRRKKKKKTLTKGTEITNRTIVTEQKKSYTRTKALVPKSNWRSSILLRQNTHHLHEEYTWKLLCLMLPLLLLLLVYCTLYVVTFVMMNTVLWYRFSCSSVLVGQTYVSCHVNVNLK